MIIILRQHIVQGSPKVLKKYPRLSEQTKVSILLHKIYTHRYVLLCHFIDKDLRAFPGHQPVLDSEELKRHYHSFLTTTREAYSTPNDDKTPNNTTQQ